MQSRNNHPPHWKLQNLLYLAPARSPLIRGRLVQRQKRSKRYSSCIRSIPILTTSTAATKAPKLNVMIRMSFSFRGNLMLVSMGIGRKRMAKSVMMLTGADDKNKVTMSMHLTVGGTGSINAAPIGRHCKVFRNVNVKPATLTTTSVAMVIHLKTSWFLANVR